jgi:uncharacterized membrane protein
MWYLILKLLHVLAAIVAVGSNVTYGIWIASASRDGTTLPFTLKVIKRIDDRMSNPAYGLLLVTGVTMMLVGGMPIATSWLVTAFVLYVALVFVGVLGYTPTLKAQIALLERGGRGSKEYLAAANRGQRLGIVIGVLVLLIILLMVMKPTLWK